MSDKIREAFDAWIASVDKRRDANGWEPLTARDVNMLREGYMEAALAQQPAPVAMVLEPEDELTPPEILAARLIDIWIENHGRQIPWEKAVEIIALVTNQPRQETDRLLAMDDVNTEIAMRAEIERLTSCLLSANKQAEHFEREWYLRGDALEDLSAEVEALRGLARECAEYLNTNELTSICHGSILHRKMMEATK